MITIEELVEIKYVMYNNTPRVVKDSYFDIFNKAILVLDNEITTDETSVVILTESEYTKMRLKVLYDIISNTQQEIDNLRESCKHETTHIGLYSGRTGSIIECEICNTCDKPIKPIL